MPPPFILARPQDSGVQRATEAPPAPMPFWSAAAAAYEAQRHVSQLGARDSLQTAALADRDADVRKRLGFGFQPPGAQAPQYDPESRLGGQFGANPATDAAPQYLSAGYEDWIDQQRELHPEAMAGVPTAQQLHDQTSHRIGDYARAGADAAAGNQGGAFWGGLAGAFTDPVNAMASLIPVGGEGRLASQIILGGARQAAYWAAVAAAEAPLKADEARRAGGPAYTANEARSDIVGGAEGGALFHAGSSIISAAGARFLRRFWPSEAPAAPAPDAPRPSPGGEETPPPPPPPGSGPTPPGNDAPFFSSTPATPGEDGRFATTAEGHVVSEAGGAVQFSSPVEAARWILREGHRVSPDQRFEPDNHPAGGFTAREFTRAPADPATAVEPEAMPAAAHAAEMGGLDDTATGLQRDGADFESAQETLRQGEPPPPIEPARSAETLLTDEEPGVTPASPPPAQPGAVIGDVTTYRGRDIYSATFDPAVVDAAPETFQYKAGGDAQGVTARLRGVQTWDPTRSDRAMVWEAPDGRYLVADGHQRLALAKRLADQGPRLDALLFRAQDGWSAEDVRTTAALTNISQGSGTPLDGAKVLREHPEALNDDSLPLSGPYMDQMRGLARLSPSAFGAVVNEVVPQRYAALIGQLAGDRPDLHDGMVDLLHRGGPANADEARALIGESLHDDWLRGEGDTADLFGGVLPQSTLIARGKVMAAVLRGARQSARVFATLVRNADAIEGGGNVLARDANEAALGSNRAAEAQIRKLAQRSGEVGLAMSGAARAVVEGRPVAEAAREVLARVLEEVRRADVAEAERKALLDPDPPSPAALARADLFGDVAGPGAEAQLRPKPEDRGPGGMKPVQLSGEEVGPPNADLKTLRAGAQRVLRAFVGRSLASSGLGRPVQLGSMGVRKATSSGGADPMRLRAVPAVPEVIERGALVHTEPNRDAATANVRAYHTLAGPVEIGGQAVVVRVTVREANNGDFYWGHYLEGGGRADRNPQTSQYKPGPGEPTSASAPENMADELSADNLEVALGAVQTGEAAVTEERSAMGDAADTLKPCAPE